jgi:hypothetical protein
MLPPRKARITSKFLEILSRQHVAVCIIVLHDKHTRAPHESSLSLPLPDDGGYILITMASVGSCAPEFGGLLGSEKAGGQAWSLATSCSATTC